MDKDEEAKSKKIVHEEIHNIVENQIREGNPEEAKRTLDRLMRSGYTRHEAVHRIGEIVVGDIYHALKENRPFDEERYIRKLKELK